MSIFQQKITKGTKREKMQLEKTEQASEPDSGMAEILELLDQKFKANMINMLRAIIEKNGQNARTDG